MPSNLEIFSNVFTEALISKKPLIVCDNEYNIEILDKYAIYFKYGNLHNLYNSIIQATKKTEDNNYLENAKNFIYSNYKHYDYRYDQIIKIIYKLCKKQI